MKIGIKFCLESFDAMESWPSSVLVTMEIERFDMMAARQR